MKKPIPALFVLGDKKHGLIGKMTAMLSTTTVLILLFSGFALTADYSVTIKEKWAQPKPGMDQCDGFPDDLLVLTIKGGKDQITNEFCSSYGKAEARIVKDAIGDSFMLLKFSHGRGTNATSDYLSVYRVDKNLIEYVRIPVSDGAGLTSRWDYDYRIDKPKQGGLIISLTLRIEGADAEWFPREKTRFIQIR